MGRGAAHHVHADVAPAYERLLPCPVRRSAAANLRCLVSVLPRQLVARTTEAPAPPQRSGCVRAPLAAPGLGGQPAQLPQCTPRPAGPSPAHAASYSGSSSTSHHINSWSGASMMAFRVCKNSAAWAPYTRRWSAVTFTVITCAHHSATQQAHHGGARHGVSRWRGKLLRAAAGQAGHASVQSTRMAPAQQHWRGL